eukprot:6109875-Amphidinium_carterae.2
MATQQLTCNRGVEVLGGWCTEGSNKHAEARHERRATATESSEQTCEVSKSGLALSRRYGALVYHGPDQSCFELKTRSFATAKRHKTQTRLLETMPRKLLPIQQDLTQ